MRASEPVITNAGERERAGEEEKIKQNPSSRNSLIEKFQGWPSISDRLHWEEGTYLMGRAGGTQLAD